VLSALRYGETAYGFTTKKKLEDLEPVNNACVRISIGAYCATRISQILNEAGIRSLAEIRKKAVTITGIRIREKSAHPLRERPNAALIYSPPDIFKSSYIIDQLYENLCGNVQIKFQY
jgi:hypothetical protein